MARRFAHRMVAAAAVVTLIGALSACSDDEPSSDPDPTPTPSATSASPSPSETETGPVEPEVPGAMDFEDKIGAKAFIKYYWDVVNYAQKTGDVKTLKTLSVPECQACQVGPLVIERAYKKGGHIKGGTYDVLNVQVNKLVDASGTTTFTCDFRARNTKETHLRRDGTVKTRYPAGTTKFRFVVHSFADGWRVVDLEARS